jgi:hypothetical protein
VAKYAQIQDLKSGEIFRVAEETNGEVYFNDGFRRWCCFNKSEEGVNYRYIPAGTRITYPKNNVMPCGKRHSKFVWCRDCYEKTFVVK